MKNVQNCQNVKMSQSGSNILESKYRLPKRGMAAGGGHSDASSEGSSASMRPHRLNTLGESMRSLGGGPGLCTLSAVSGIKPGTLDRTEIRLTRWNAFVAKFGPQPLAVAVSEVIYLYIWQPHYFVPMRGSDRRHWDEDLQQAGASRWLTSWSLRCAARRSWHLG